MEREGEAEAEEAELNTEERQIASECATLLVVQAEAEDMFIMEKEVRKEIDIRPMPVNDETSEDKPPTLGGNEHIVAVRVDTSRYDTPRNITFMIFDSDSRKQ